MDKNQNQKVGTHTPPKTRQQLGTYLICLILTCCATCLYKGKLLLGEENSTLENQTKVDKAPKDPFIYKVKKTKIALFIGYLFSCCLFSNLYFGGKSSDEKKSKRTTIPTEEDIQKYTKNYPSTAKFMRKEHIIKRIISLRKVTNH